MTPKQTGFTLLELLVVITLLGIIAGGAVLGYEGVQDQGREDVARFEMAEIRKALLQFRRDSGSNDFPGQGGYDCALLADSVLNDGVPASWTSGVPELNAGNKAGWIDWCKHPANFWMLFIDPIGDGWDEDRKRGWHGPYLQRKNGYVAVDADFKNNGSLATESNTVMTGLWGIASPYVSEPFSNGHLAWSLTSSGAVLERYGTPYFLFDLNDDATTARIQSLGANHQFDDDYDDETESGDCLPPIDALTGETLDDDVLCLLR